MTESEITTFVDRSRTLTLATLNQSGHPHQVAMWYGLVGSKICFETKTKSQKVLNLRRNPAASVLIEAGSVYGELRGVSLEGEIELVEDPHFLWDVGVSVWERYNGLVTPAVEPQIEAMLSKRIAAVLHVRRTRSWDHRKLGLAPSTPAGTTSAYLT